MNYQWNPNLNKHIWLQLLKPTFWCFQARHINREKQWRESTVITSIKQHSWVKLSHSRTLGNFSLNRSLYHLEQKTDTSVRVHKCCGPRTTTYPTASKCNPFTKQPDERQSVPLSPCQVPDHRTPENLILRNTLKTTNNYERNRNLT